MDSVRPTLFLGVALLLAGCASRQATLSPVLLFNDHDLTGWVVMHGGDWTVEDGVLTATNGSGWSTNPEVSGSWLRTARPYENFLLELEYTVQGNSGIFLRSGLEKNPAFTGYEMQLLSDHGRPTSTGSAGGLYDVVAPLKNMTRPTGEWNRVRILVEGDQIQILLNDEMVVDYDDATRSRAGYIGLQNHDENSVARFRNIRLTELRGSGSL